MCVLETPNGKGVRFGDAFLGEVIEELSDFHFRYQHQGHHRRAAVLSFNLNQPPASSFSRIRRFISRLIPYRVRITFESGKVVLLFFQAM